MSKYTVLVGTNAPDPTGKRDEKGRPVEVRFEAGDEISEQSVSSGALENLLKSGAIALVKPVEAPAVPPVLPPPPPAAVEGKK